MSVDGVGEVSASPTDHTVTATFDDETVKLDSILKALGDAGYTVGEPVKVK